MCIFYNFFCFVKHMYLIGIDVGGTSIKAGLVDIKAGLVLRRQDTETKRTGTQVDVLEQIVTVVEPLMGRGVKAIGVGVPSIVIDGVPKSVVNVPGLNNAPLAKTLQGRFRVPVHVGNDAMCFVTGEGYFRYKEYMAPGKTLVGVILGTGFAARAIINGRPFYGRTHGAGELGESEYRDGKLEPWVSGQFFEREFQTTGAELYEQAKQGDARALSAFEQFGAHASEAIARVVQAYDPDAIVLGGSVSRAYGLFQLAMLRNLKDKIYPESFDGLQIFVSQNPDSGIFGAAALHLVGQQSAPAKGA